MRTAAILDRASCLDDGPASASNKPKEGFAGGACGMPRPHSAERLPRQRGAELILYRQRAEEHRTERPGVATERGRDEKRIHVRHFR